jgi:hypothetical protein
MLANRLDFVFFQVPVILYFLILLGLCSPVSSIDFVLVLNGSTKSFYPNFALFVRFGIQLEVELSRIEVELVAELALLFILTMIEFDFHNVEKRNYVTPRLSAGKLIICKKALLV